ncbi:MAG: hypothetical protein AB4038_10390 [Prochloraceae cyanobacterium]
MNETGDRFLVGDRGSWNCAIIEAAPLANRSFRMVWYNNIIRSRKAIAFPLLKRSPVIEEYCYLLS